MSSPVIRYNEPVFRPPSEAASLIVQATLGCSWNACSFCEMYTSKRFQTRPFELISADLHAAAADGHPWRRIFLADGDAMVLSPRRLLEILEEIRAVLPAVRRVSAYALPANLLKKSVEELRALREAGLSLIYVGIESGDDAVLMAVNKGETTASTIEGLQRAREAGIKTSVMIISGLGGKARSREHAIASAQVLNATQPEYASLLTLMHPFGPERFLAAGQAGYEMPDLAGLLAETALFLDATELEQTVFRSDHASNYLVLRGTLGRDKERLLAQVRGALDDPAHARLRPEWARGL